MRLVHVELKEANEFVARHHRHHKPVVGHRFSVGAQEGGVLVGVCIAGRPVARMTDHLRTVEVTRLCTDGTKNACSFLYAAAAAEKLGYHRIQTFILDSEPGSSLRAAGWRFDGVFKEGQWVHTSGPRRTDQPTCPKQRWVKDLQPRGWPKPEASS